MAQSPDAEGYMHYWITFVAIFDSSQHIMSVGVFGYCAFNFYVYI